MAPSQEISPGLLTLASSQSSPIPAFVFFRPSISSNEWSPSGEISVVKPNSVHTLFFQPCAGPESVKLAFPASVLGLFPPMDRFYQFSKDMEKWVEECIISFNIEEGFLYLRISEAWKEKIWREASAPQVIQALLRLVRLIMLSLPDPYVDTFWELLSIRCKDIIRSTVLPFLSGVESYEGSLFEYDYPM
jgi:hypothetical protein